MTEYARARASARTDPPPAEKARVTKQRKPLRKVSAKRAKLNREVKGWRAAFINEVERCQVCGKKFKWDTASPEMMDLGCLFTRKLSVHEIAKGSLRGFAMKHRACCLVVCSKCNCDDLCDYSKWPIERQLAVKLITDPEYFDLELFNKVRGRAPTAITLADVVPYLDLRG